MLLTLTFFIAGATLAAWQSAAWSDLPALPVVDALWRGKGIRHLEMPATPQRVFSRDAIIDRLHGPGFAITDRTIDSHVRNLRAKFSAAGCATLIETRPGVGYRLGACAV